jgi:hypothetical protein
MTLTSLIHSVGNIGIFPSRAFIPAFLTALLLRFGHDITGSQYSDLAQHVSQVPNWFTSDPMLIILGILSVLEIAATKSSDIREFLHEFDQYIKPIMAFLTTQGVLTAADIDALKAIDPGHPASTGLSIPNLGISAAVAAAVYQMSSMRSGVMSMLSHADPHDDLGLQRLISWGEDLWSIFGWFLILIFPVAMLLIVAIFAGLLFALQQYLHYREEKSKIPCVKCAVPIYPTALACPSCKTHVAQPHAIGFLGTGSASLSTLSRDSHALELISKKRCPVCATRFPQRAARQVCSACGHSLMSNSGEVTNYLNHVDQRLPRTLAICTGLGFIPILGIIPGIIYFRMKLVTPFRQYLTFSTGILTKWGVRVLNLVLILLQAIPGFGAVMVPVMAYTNYRVYREVYTQAVNSAPTPAAPVIVFSAPMPAPVAPMQPVVAAIAVPQPTPISVSAPAQRQLDEEELEQGHS